MKMSNRRNLTPMQRIAIAEKYRPTLQKLAKENMLSTQNNNQGSALQKSSKQIDTVRTRDELAKIAKVS